MADLKVEGLTGKRVLITGASRGIGRAIALLFSKFLPDKLYLLGRSKTELNELAMTCEKLGAKKAEVIVADLSDLEATQEVANLLLSTSHDGYGVDVLVNNAAAIVEGSACEGNVKEWSNNINVNLLAPMILTRLLVPMMQKRQSGVVICIGSVAAVEGMTGNGLYSTTKFGLRGWSLHCYRKLRYDNIKTMIIHPGFVATDMVLGSRKDPKLLGERMIQPEDIAEVAMMPFRTSAGCCPEEITLRLTRSAYAT